MTDSIPDKSTDHAWEEWGRRDPYYGVITHPKFRRNALTDDAKREFFASSETHAQYILSTIRKHINPDFSPRRILDFGCGVGRLLVAFAAIADEVVGVDVSASMLEEARRNCDQRQLKNVLLVPSDDEVSAVSGSFDLIHSFIVFQHIPVERGRLIFTNLIRRLRPGGIAAVHLTYSKSRFADTHGVSPPKPLTRAVPVSPEIRDGADPEMQMNPYNMNEMLFLMQRHGVQQFYTDFSDHGGELGVFLFFALPGSRCEAGTLEEGVTAEKYESTASDLDRFLSKLSRTDYLPTPRDDQLYCGGGDYKKIGLDFLRYFIEVGELEVDERIVEIGCGLGRLASPLTQYLTRSGSYYGIDIVADAIEWCNRNINQKYPSFRFHHKNAYHSFYNKTGTLSENDVAVPIADGAADFVVLASVFTHLHRDTVLAYLGEIRRLLSPSGRCFVTWFLIDDVSSALMEKTRLARTDGKRGPSIFVLDPNAAGTEFYANSGEPLAAVGFPRADVLRWISDAGFRVLKDIPGHWSGRMDGYTQQDILLIARAD
jgi:SAM-dependent methyltransferase